MIISKKKKQKNIQQQFVSIVAILTAAGVWDYCASPLAMSSVQAMEQVSACNVCAADELSLMGPTTGVRWFIDHLQPCLTVLTASRVRLLFNLQTCRLKPRVDVISSPDFLFFFFHFTFIHPLSHFSSSLLQRDNYELWCHKYTSFLDHHWQL